MANSKHSHNASPMTYYQHRIQKKEPVAFNNTLSVAINALLVKLCNSSKKYNGKNDKKVKEETSEALIEFQNSIYNDPNIYQLFLSDYMQRNKDKFGDFYDKISSAIGKIKNLDFKGLTPDQVQAKISALFEENLKDDALHLAEDLKDNFEKDKEEIVKARMAQFKLYKEEIGDSSPLANLTYQEFENLIKNTPSLLDTTPEQISNIEPEVLERIAKADNVTIYEDCSFNHCFKDSPYLNMSDAKTCADFAKENNQNVHLGTMIESTSFSNTTVEYNAEDLKNMFSLYLDNINNTFEEVASCTFFTNILYDPGNTDLYESYSNVETVDVSNSTTKQEQFAYTFSADSYTDKFFDSSKIETSSQTVESEPILYNPCAWQTLGNDWYIQLLEMGKEKMPNTKFYISESGIENPEKAKKLEKLLNNIRDYEQKKEDETGKDCTLLDGICIPLDFKADEKTVENIDKINSNLKVVIEGAKNGFVESEKPIRFTESKVEKVSKNIDGTEISDDLATKRQKDVYKSVTELVTSYSDISSGYEIGGFESSYTIDGSQIYMDIQTDSSPYLFDNKGNPKDELNATAILQSIAQGSQKNKKQESQSIT